MARFDYYDKFSELEKDNIKAREGGIRDLHMRVKQMQYDNLIMSEAIMNNNKNINNIFELLQDEVDLSSRTYLWDDTPRLDLDNHPDVILETVNNNTIPYMCTEYKHIKSGSRVDISSLRKDYNFKVFLGVADNLEVIKIASKPNSLDFGSSRSTLITLDSFDASAIIVNVKAI